MIDLFGYRQMSPLDLETQLTEEVRHKEEIERRDKVKAGAYAHVLHSFGISMKEMTPAQRSMAEATARAWSRRESSPRGYGFSISTVDRKPQFR